LSLVCSPTPPPIAYIDHITGVIFQYIVWAMATVQESPCQKGIGFGRNSRQKNKTTEQQYTTLGGGRRRQSTKRERVKNGKEGNRMLQIESDKEYEAE
jgi:hypothetical protein